MRSQTSLPDDLTQPIQETATWARGYTIPQPLQNPAGKMPLDQPARWVDFKPSNYYTQTIYVSSSPVVLAGANESRRALMIQNNSANILYVGIGVQPALTGVNAFQIPVGGYWGFENGFCPNNVVWAVAAASSLVCVVEGG